MFDFIEEEIPKEEKKNDTPTSTLEGTVYTMPAHRATVTSSTMEETSKKKSGMFIIVLVGVGIVVIATVFLVWWAVFLPSTSTQPQSPSTSTQNSQQPETPVAIEQPTTPPETPPSDQSQASQPSTTPTPATPNLLPYVKGQDSDSDDLTDTEEKIFNTDPQKPDTDGDGYLDGAEVKFLYDPTKLSTKLDTSSSVTLYKNPAYAYALLYPSSWVVDSVDKEKKEVIFSSATGEFVTMKVQDNPEKLTALDWYTTVHKPNTDTSSLQTMKYDTWTGVMSEDGLEVYMTANDDKGSVITPYVYVLTYDLGGKKEMNFGSVFQMMIRSFLITDLSFVR